MMRNALKTDDKREELLVDAADLFVQQLRLGGDPSVEEYADRYPEVATAIRQTFPALRTLELSDSASRLIALTGCEREALGDFRLVREIGRGGMGIVYEAVQLSLDRRVALKVLPFAAVMDPRQLLRFKNEAQAIGMLKHPNIVGVYFVGCDRGVHYYAMELVEGKNLAQLVQGLYGESDCDDQEKVLPDEETARLAALSTKFTAELSGNSQEFFHSVAGLGVQAAEALEYAHERGIVHRDVKPSNLLVSADRHVTVTDFGLAAIDGVNVTVTGDLLGTLRYMSPEQASGNRRQLDHRTDVYSLGITLYELLTGRPAFEGNDRQGLLRDIVDREPPAPRTLSSRIPRDLETIVLKGISKEPRSRYATMAELAADLRRFLENRPIHARRAARMHLVSRWCRRNPLLAAMATCLAVMICICGWLGTAWLTSGYRARIGRSGELTLRRLPFGVDDTSGQISPVGSGLSFTNWDTANIGILNLKNGVSRYVTSDGTWDGPEEEQQYGEQSVWSPDGQQLAYNWFIRGAFELRTIARDGTNRCTICQNKALSYVVPLSWSNDGTQILTGQKTEDGTSRFALICPEDGSERILASFTSRHPGDSCLSPSGRFVVFCRPPADDDPQRDIFLLDIQNDTIVPVIEHAADEYSPIWTPDGRWLLFVSHRQGSPGLWVARFSDGRVIGRPQLIYEKLGGGRPLGISREGNYYFATESRDRDLYVAAIDFRSGSVVKPPERIDAPYEGVNVAGDWSPDGKRLAYVSQFDFPRNSLSLTVCGPDGQQRRLPLSDPIAESTGMLSWSADGKLVVIRGSDALRRGAWYHYSVDPDTGATTRLDRDKFPAPKSVVAVCEGGGFRYFVETIRDGAGIVRLDPKTGQRTHIYRPAVLENISNFSLSPDSRQLAFSIGGQIRLLPTSGGDAHVLYEVPKTKALPWLCLTWARDSKSLLAGIAPKEDPKSVSLWQIQTDDRSARPIGITMPNLAKIRVHPDGQQVLFQVRGPGDCDNDFAIWAIDNLLTRLNAKGE